MNGAGHRGMETYGAYALNHPDQIKFIAIADPDEIRRKQFQLQHNISDQMAFDSWETLMPETGKKIADVAFICTQDRMHYAPAMRAMSLGYDLFLEKPISSDLQECLNLEEKARSMNCTVQVGHVLRFTPFFKRIKSIIQSGLLGDILQIEHSENVSYWHFGHSYVRGPYKNEVESSPLILAKTCHDLDIIYWILGEKAIDVNSTGQLSFYRPENAPENAPERCTDGCPHAAECPWYAPRLYITAEPLLRIGQHSDSFFYRILSKWAINHRKLMKFLGRFSTQISQIMDWRSWPATVISTDLSYEGRMKALREGPYGKCIYKCENDVVDHQTAVYRFPSGATAIMRVNGVSDLEGRELKIFGTKGTLRGTFRNNGEKLIFRDFRYNNTQVLFKAGLNFDQHGGGDAGIMDAFIKILRKEAEPAEVGTANIFDAMESHYMGFAADIARKERKVVNLQNIRKK